MVPDHIKRDLSNLAYERTIETLKRTAFTFGSDAELCAIAGNAGLRAAFAFLFLGLKRGSAGPLTAKEILDIWVENSANEMLKLDKFYREESNNV